MNRLLVVLALVGAVPGGAQEACDMAQKPIAYPGAVLSRNAQIRAQAIQGAAYVAMAPASARFPVTFDEGLMAAPGVAPLTADKARFARLKFRDDAGFTAGAINVVAGIPGAGTIDVGAAIYEYQPTVSGFDLALLFGAFATQVNGGVAIAEMAIPSPFAFDRTKAYVLGYVSANPAGMPSAAFNTQAYGASLSNGYSTGYAEAIASVTRTTGWPNRIHATNAIATTEMLYGYTSMIFGFVSPPGSQIQGMVY